MIGLRRVAPIMQADNAITRKKGGTALSVSNE
jgi:hypothetical protein